MKRYISSAVHPFYALMTDGQRILLVVLGIVLVIILGIQGMQFVSHPSTTLRSTQHAAAPPVVASPGMAFIASIDTMKESRDTEANPLTDAQIAADVSLCARLNTNYITVDTYLDDASYMQRWVSAIRATGKHVWFRWGAGSLGSGPGAAVTSSQYLALLRAFILANPSLFQPGDVLDADAEPEGEDYWVVTYGPNWSWQPTAPNAATDEFNNFVLGLTETADEALHQLGLHGVITTVHSVDPWTAEHPEVLYNSTIQRMGNLIVVDAYPDADITNPASAAQAWVAQLARIHAARPTARVLIGEMGYSNDLNVGDTRQRAVLQAELDAISTVPYVAGVNYWVGAGTDTSGGYTHIFSGHAGSWAPRPAASVLAEFFARKLQAAH